MRKLLVFLALGTSACGDLGNLSNLDSQINQNPQPESQPVVSPVEVEHLAILTVTGTDGKQKSIALRGISF